MPLKMLVQEYLQRLPTDSIEKKPIKVQIAD